MTVQGNGAPKVYHVSHLGSVKQALRKQYRDAKLQGMGKEYLAALRHIYHRLRHDPHGFGEPLFHLRAVKLLIHTAIHAPFTISSAFTRPNRL
jgi:hypothetical protein